jgi:hypothetical protein
MTAAVRMPRAIQRERIWRWDGSGRAPKNIFRSLEYGYMGGSGVKGGLRRPVDFRGKPEEKEKSEMELCSSIANDEIKVKKYFAFYRGWDFVFYPMITRGAGLGLRTLYEKRSKGGLEGKDGLGGRVVNCGGRKVYGHVGRGDRGGEAKYGGGFKATGCLFGVFRAGA